MNKNELTMKCKIDNFLWSCSFIYNALFLPFFIYNISKNNRSGKRIVKTVLLSYFLQDGKISPATVENNALWLNTIPTHSLYMYWRFEGDILGLEVGIVVPETQAFIADVRLQQWGNELGYIVTSAPQMQNGIPSTKYAGKMYKQKNIRVKNKSVDMAVGRALWGANVRTYTNQPKEKKVKLGKAYS